jgi:hypothetical protein
MLAVTPGAWDMLAETITGTLLSVGMVPGGS